MAVASYLCSDVFGLVLGKRNYKASKVGQLFCVSTDTMYLHDEGC